MAYLNTQTNIEEMRTDLEAYRKASTSQAQREIDSENALVQLRLNNAKAIYDMQQKHDLLLTANGKRNIIKENQLKKQYRIQEQSDELDAQEKVITDRLKREATIQNTKQKLSEATTKKDKKNYEKLLKNEQKANNKQNANDQKTQAKKSKQELFDNKKAQQEKAKQAEDAARSTWNSADSSTSDKIEAFKKLKTETNTGAALVTAFDSLTVGLSNIAQKLDSQIEEIAGYQSAIDTRLNGTGLTYETKDFSDVSGLADILTKAIGVSPYIKLKDVMSNLSKLVDEGIAYNVEQRAFLQTIADDIATTFDAANGTLLQLIRSQQSDTTAARLGEEAYLNEFLNSMFSDTSYLNSLNDTVASGIYEAMSKMSADEGVAFDYQVEKWLGSLYSVGMTDSGVSAIATALGYLGSGDITSLASDTGMQNLLVMAASNAGLSYADLLSNGLTADSTNKLLESMVDYLADIANSSSSTLVQAQYADIYGLSLSDLTAAKNLSSSLDTVSASSLSYNSAINNLNDMSNSIYSRLSTGEMMENAWSNFTYNLSENIASSPALYGIWKTSEMLDDLVGGINIPTVSVMGTSVDLEATVADLMQVGALSASVLEGVGTIVDSLNSSSKAGFSASGMLETLGIQGSSANQLVRGTGISNQTSGSSTSVSSYVGNASGSDLYDASLTSAEDTKKSLTAEAKTDDTSASLDTMQEQVVNIYKLLSAVVDGTSSLTVKVEDYGLSFN